MSNPLQLASGVIAQGTPAPSTTGNPISACFYNSVVKQCVDLATIGTTTGQAAGTGGFFLQGGISVIGVWTYWAGGAVTLDNSLWLGPYNNAVVTAYTKVASGSLAVSGAGYYFIPFSAAYLVTVPMTGWAATVYESTGTTCTYATNPPNKPTLTTPVIAGPYVAYSAWDLYNTSNTSPPSSTSTDSFPVEPVCVWSTTTTNGSYVQPSVGGQVVITLVGAVSWIVPGMVLFIANGGVYRVVSVSGATVTAISVSDATNGVAPGSTVASNAIVYG